MCLELATRGVVLDMSVIEELLKSVQQEADRQQDEIIRRLVINYPVGGKVCCFQTLISKLIKLKKNFKKNDSYLKSIANRANFSLDKSAFKNFDNLTEMLVGNYQNYTSKEIVFLEQMIDLAKEINQIENLILFHARCGMCIACNPRNKFRR